MFFRSCRGQATVETALVLMVGIIPLTFGLIAFAEIAWTVQIDVSYWTYNPATHESEAFSCSSSCSAQCVPDSVTVGISGYQFNHFLTLLGLQPLQVPPFSTTIEIESAGGNPETASL